MKKKALSLVSIVLLLAALSLPTFAQEASASEPGSSSISGNAEVVQQSSAEAKYGKNTPLYVIAGCSVLGFIGVYIYCKKNGRNG